MFKQEQYSAPESNDAQAARKIHLRELHEQVIAQPKAVFLIKGKRLEARPSQTRKGEQYYEMVDDPESSITARIHKATPQGFNLNVYNEQREVVYYMRLDQSNIDMFTVEVSAETPHRESV